MLIYLFNPKMNQREQYIYDYADELFNYIQVKRAEEDDNDFDIIAYNVYNDAVNKLHFADSMPGSFNRR